MRFWARAMNSAVTIKDVADLGGDEVFLASEMTAKWKGSQMTLSEPRFAVVTVREGLITRLNVHRDRAEALELPGSRE